MCPYSIAGATWIYFPHMLINDLDRFPFSLHSFLSSYFSLNQTHAIRSSLKPEIWNSGSPKHVSQASSGPRINLHPFSSRPQHPIFPRHTRYINEHSRKPVCSRFASLHLHCVRNTIELCFPSCSLYFTALADWIIFPRRRGRLRNGITATVPGTCNFSWNRCMSLQAFRTYEVLRLCLGKTKRSILHSQLPRRRNRWRQSVFVESVPLTLWIRARWASWVSPKAVRHRGKERGKPTWNHSHRFRNGRCASLAGHSRPSPWSSTRFKIAYNCMKSYYLRKVLHRKCYIKDYHYY